MGMISRLIQIVIGYSAGSTGASQTSQERVRNNQKTLNEDQPSKTNKTRIARDLNAPVYSPKTQPRWWFQKAAKKIPQTESLHAQLSNGAKVLGISIEGFHTPGTNNDSIHVIENEQYDICCVADGVSASDSGSIESGFNSERPEHTGKFWADNLPKEFAKALDEIPTKKKRNIKFEPPQEALSIADCASPDQIFTWAISGNDDLKAGIRMVEDIYNKRLRKHSELFQGLQLKSHAAYNRLITGEDFAVDFYEKLGLVDDQEENLRDLHNTMGEKVKEPEKRKIFYALINKIFNTSLDFELASDKELRIFTEKALASMGEGSRINAEIDLESMESDANTEKILGTLAQYKAKEISKLIYPKRLKANNTKSNIFKALTKACNKTSKSFQEKYKYQEYIDPDYLYGGFATVFYIFDKKSKKHYLVSAGDSQYLFRSNKAKRKSAPIKKYKKIRNKPQGNNHPHNITDYNDGAYSGSYINWVDNIITYPSKGFSIQEIPAEALKQGGEILLYSDGLLAKTANDYGDACFPDFGQRAQKRNFNLLSEAVESKAQKNKLFDMAEIILGKKASRKEQKEQGPIFPDGYSRLYTGKDAGDDISMMLISLPPQGKKSK